MATYQNRLKEKTLDRKEKSLLSLSSVLENVQKLNENIRNQSTSLMHSTSFAVLDQQRKNRNFESTYQQDAKKQICFQSVNSIDLSLGGGADSTGAINIHEEPKSASKLPPTIPRNEGLQ